MLPASPVSGDNGERGGFDAGDYENLNQTGGALAELVGSQELGKLSTAAKFYPAAGFVVDGGVNSAKGYPSGHALGRAAATGISSVIVCAVAGSACASSGVATLVSWGCAVAGVSWVSTLRGLPMTTFADVNLASNEMKAKLWTMNCRI
ncbi:hypothetical protein GCM10028833_39810 [Glycomyces tarimensis]